MSVSGDEPVVIGGFYRSGTTLLRRLLDAHSAVFAGPEVKFFKDFNGDYLRDGLRHARFFTTVRGLGLPDDELLEVLGGGYLETLRRATERAGKRRWADKNPENVLYLDQWSRLLSDRFLFVHVVRNPLDALASLLEVGFEKAVPAGFDEKVELYAKFHRHAVAFESAHPERSHRVRYEELVSRARETLEELMAFLGERFEPAMLDAVGGDRGPRVMEDPKFRETESIHDSSVGRWRSELTAEQIDEAVRRLSSVFVELGYPIPEG